MYIDKDHGPYIKRHITIKTTTPSLLPCLLLDSCRLSREKSGLNSLRFCRVWSLILLGWVTRNRHLYLYWIKPAFDFDYSDWKYKSVVTSQKRLMFWTDPFCQTDLFWSRPVAKDIILGVYIRQFRMSVSYRSPLFFDVIKPWSTTPQRKTR